MQGTCPDCARLSSAGFALQSSRTAAGSRAHQGTRLNLQRRKCTQSLRCETRSSVHVPGCPEPVLVNPSLFIRPWETRDKKRELLPRHHASAPACSSARASRRPRPRLRQQSSRCRRLSCGCAAAAVRAPAQCRCTRTILSSYRITAASRPSDSPSLGS